MRIDPEELELAKAYWSIRPFEGLTEEQTHQIRDRSRRLYQWFKTHQHVHYAISLGVIAFLLSADLFVLLVAPKFVMAFWPSSNLATLLLSAIIVGFLRGWVMYSLNVFSLHEGAAHQLIFPPRGWATKILNVLANNLCRLAGADPVYYAESHVSHHAKFGTEEDGEFANFVRPRRYLATLVPYAMFLNFGDFIVHRPLSYTWSRAVSECVTGCYNLGLVSLMAVLFGPVFAIVTVAVVFPHVAFQLDRLRNFSEHNLMPLESRHGARSFGPGFWGLLIGGGPWGQPCHWMHHLVPGIPWYQQILLHLHVSRILSEQQRKQWLLDPLIGYPKLLWRLWRKPSPAVRSLHQRDVPASMYRVD
jgi:hypothetical protein